ncbi:hypothetical protein [Halobacillus mangrovi]|nr:hypothetical protein [Halobacillus mangrovi]
MGLIAVVIALLLLVALLVAVLLGTPEQQQYIMESIQNILDTIGS